MNDTRLPIELQFRRDAFTVRESYLFHLVNQTGLPAGLPLLVEFVGLRASLLDVSPLWRLPLTKLFDLYKAAVTAGEDATVEAAAQFARENAPENQPLEDGGENVM